MTSITIFANPNAYFDDLAQALKAQGANVIYLQARPDDECKDLIASIKMPNILVADNSWLYKLKQDFVETLVISGYDFMYVGGALPSTDEEITAAIAEKMIQTIQDGRLPILIQSHISDHYRSTKRDCCINGDEWEEDDGRFVEFMAKKSYAEGTDFQFLTCFGNKGLRMEESYGKFVFHFKQNVREMMSSLPENAVILADHHIFKYPDVLSVVKTFRPQFETQTPDTKTKICLVCPCCEGIIGGQDRDFSREREPELLTYGFEIYSPFGTPEKRAAMIKNAAEKIIEIATAQQRTPPNDPQLAQ